MRKKRTTRIDRALAFAINAHGKQKRKADKQIPYIVHPVSVALHLQRHGVSEDVIIAAILHDVVEDTSVTIGKVKKLFGDKVARLVDGVTESSKKHAWADRKAAYVKKVMKAPMDSKLISAADKINNTQSLILLMESKGKKMQKKFNATFERQLNHYGSLAEKMQKYKHPLFKEMKDIIEEAQVLLKTLK